MREAAVGLAMGEHRATGKIHRPVIALELQSPQPLGVEQPEDVVPVDLGRRLVEAKRLASFWDPFPVIGPEGEKVLSRTARSART